MKYAIPLVLLLVAAWARFGALGEDVRFHGDEALFATYARSTAVYGDWMVSGPLDKPPLSLYAMALSMQFTGVTHLPDGVLTLEPKRGEWSARLPGVLAGIVTVALVMAAARRAGGRRASWFAGALAALSPHMVAFSATAFTDPLLLAFLSASLLTALSGRAGWSGVWLAAAFATKQQAVFYAPLVALLCLTARASFVAERGVRDEVLLVRRLRRFLAALLLGVGVLLAWDMLRPDLSIFAYAADNNNPYRLLVPIAEWPSRASLLVVFLSTAFGAPLVTAGVVTLAIVGVVWLDITKRSENDTGRRVFSVRRSRLPVGNGVHTERNLFCAFFSVFSVSLWFNLFFLFVFFYLIVHVVLPFNIYDRYLLLVYPPIVVLAAVALSRLVPRALLIPALVFVLILPATNPARYPTDVRDRNDGFIALADFINEQGIGTIVYNHWLGWEMGYYLGPWSDKRVVYYPTHEALAADAPRNADTAPRLFIAPAWTPASTWLDAAVTAGFNVRSAYRSADYAAWWFER